MCKKNEILHGLSIQSQKLFGDARKRKQEFFVDALQPQYNISTVYVPGNETWTSRCGLFCMVRKELLERGKTEIPILKGMWYQKNV